MDIYLLKQEIKSIENQEFVTEILRHLEHLGQF